MAKARSTQKPPPKSKTRAQQLPAAARNNVQPVPVTPDQAATISAAMKYANSPKGQKQWASEVKAATASKKSAPKATTKSAADSSDPYGPKTAGGKKIWNSLPAAERAKLTAADQDAYVRSVAFPRPTPKQFHSQMRSVANNDERAGNVGVDAPDHSSGRPH